MKQRYALLALLAFSSQAVSQTDHSSREDWMNWFQSESAGWQTQCSVQINRDDRPTNCNALFPLSDGIVSLQYESNELRVSVIGKCGYSLSGKTYALPMYEPARAIKEAAKIQPNGCKPPVLTSQLYSGVSSLNIMLTLISEPLK